MRVPGKLQGYPGFFRHIQVAWLVDQQYTGALAIKRGPIQQ
jgi:hypothetical protein